MRGSSLLARDSLDTILAIYVCPMIGPAVLLRHPSPPSRRRVGIGPLRQTLLLHPRHKTRGYLLLSITPYIT